MRQIPRIGWIAVLMAIAAAPTAADKKRAQPVTIATGVSPGPVTMETVNASWKGSRCQIRFGPEIPRGKTNTGWSRSKWILAPTLPGDKKRYLRLWVSDRAALDSEGYLRRGKFIRPGTPFIALGWSFQNATKRKDLVLGLRFEQVPVQARLEFRDTKAIDLEDMERLAKVELFQVLGKPPPTRLPPSVQQRRVAETVQQPKAGSPPILPPTEAPPIPTSDSVYRPTVEVHAASVNPAQVFPGSQISLMIHYEVSGIPAGTSFEVVERRILKREGRVLVTFEEKLPRASGSYTSAQQIDVSAGMSVGIYSLEAEVSLAGVTAKASALFEIR